MAELKMPSRATPAVRVQSLQELLRAAQRACDHWNDGPSAREAMRLDCINTPEHLRADLIRQFELAYPINGAWCMAAGPSIPVSKHWRNEERDQ